MAQIREEILIDVKLEKGQNDQQITDLTKRIIELQAANKNLVAQNKEVAKTQGENSKEYVENSKQIELNKQKISEASASRKGLVTTLQAEDNSIKALTVRNRELIKARDLINTSTVEGRQRISEINQQLDANNQKIKENVSALEQQKINIGNYASALDGVVPGLGGFVNGLQNGTKAALAFIATPLGAILGAIGLALGALIEYFKGTEEGQDRLNKITQIGSAILGKLGDVVRDVGEAIFNAFTDPKQALEDFVNFLRQNVENRIQGLLELIPALGKAITLAFKGEFAEAGQVAFDAVAKVSLGIEDASSKIVGLVNDIRDTVDLAISEGSRVADLQKEIRNLERAYSKESAETSLRVAKIRSDATKAEGEERRALIEEAIALEQKLGDQAVKIAEKRLELAQIEDAIADNNIDANNALVAAEVELIKAQQQRFDATLRFEKQLEAVNKEIEADRKKRADEEKKLALEIQQAERDQLQANLKFLEEKNIEEINIIKQKYLDGTILKEEYEAELTRIELEALEERRDFLIANGEETLAIDTAIINAKIKNQERLNAEVKKQSDADLKDKKKKQQDELTLAQDSFEFAEGLFEEGTAAQKAAAVAQTGISTYSAAQKAFESQLIPGDPTSLPRATFAAAFAVVQGLARLALLKGFAEGGLTGTLIKPGMGVPITRSNGDNMLATVKTGEVILNQRQQALLGGPETFRKIGVPGFATGGITGETTRIAAVNANSQIDLSQLAGLINAQQPVLVLEEFETKQGSVNDVKTRAQVI
jgi:hypothetical protein